MARPPNPETQEARILEVLRDRGWHTLHDWPRRDTYTGRNAIGRLERRGYPIARGWVTIGRRAYRAYRLLLPAPQEELRLAA